MDVTLLLAKIWGPVLLAVGLGVFISRPYYIKIYRDMEKNALAVLIFGMSAMAAGIAHIIFHSEWITLPQIVISLLGWGLVLKGTLFVVAPNLVDRAGDWWVKTQRVPIAGILTLIAGLYLSWVGYIIG